MTKRNKHVEKKFYLPTHGSIEELNDAVGRVNQYIDEHEWPHPPSYSLGKDSLEVFGLRRKKDDTTDIPVIILSNPLLLDRFVGPRPSDNEGGMESIWKRVVRNKDA